jgi:hypothetical protein
MGLRYGAGIPRSNLNDLQTGSGVGRTGQEG